MMSAILSSYGFPLSCISCSYSGDKARHTLGRLQGYWNSSASVAHTPR